ncbi:MAG: exo-alpha-sialidase [Planctomycetes bacterium]|nr:exo-alpha-sialidase [Planctomycetota bacterium]
MLTARRFAWLLVLGLSGTNLAAGEGATVSTLRVPNGGIQPQVQVDAQGVVHMLYFKGEAKGGDIFYVKSKDGAAWSEPLKANSKDGSAIAIGNVRGPHLAVGKNGRVHVGWMGSGAAEPKAPGNQAPMLYARLSDDGKSFEPQRNVMQVSGMLDGGGTVAADANGNVYVVWHGCATGAKGEENRAVWIARSTDEGKTFARETAAFAQPTGACGCCGISAYCDSKGDVYILYRSAMKRMDRDMFLLVSKDKGQTFQGADIHAWKVGACVMSTTSFYEAGDGVLLTWETKEQIYFGKTALGAAAVASPIAAPGEAPRRKHSAVASNASGETVLAWAEGMEWGQGGTVHWQVYDKTGKPTTVKGQADGVPMWSLVAAFAKPDGSFVVVY